MDLELSVDQIELRDNIRNVLEGSCSRLFVRGVYEGTCDVDQLWKQMVELYWPALAIPEVHGGLGLGFVEIALLAEELGRATAPGPLLATSSQFTPMLVEAGAGDMLRQVAEGVQTGSLAVAEAGRWSRTPRTTVATRTGNSWTLSGTKTAVLSGAAVDCFAVTAVDGDSGNVGVYLVSATDARIAPTGGLEPTLELADVMFAASDAVAIIAPTSGSAACVERALEQAEVAMAFNTVGACRRIFEETLGYAKVRVQYDHVIGSYQALKHRFANMYLAVERATAVCYFAAIAIAEDDPGRAEAVHIAKIAAGDCQRLVAGDGLQLHGGIGFTWEHDLHFLLKRAKAGELLCGGSAAHRAALAERLDLHRAGSAAVMASQVAS